MHCSHCPEGFLREHALSVAAIGLRVAADNLRLKWSWQAQTQHEEKKNAADTALQAWNAHIQCCPVCRDNRSRVSTFAFVSQWRCAARLLRPADTPCTVSPAAEAATRREIPSTAPAFGMSRKLRARVASVQGSEPQQSTIRRTGSRRSGVDFGLNRCGGWPHHRGETQTWGS